MSRLITKMANTSARVNNRITKEFVFGTMTRSAASAPTTANTLTSSRVILHSFPSEQAGRLDRQNQCHQRTDRGAAEAAHAANDDHGESQRQDLKVKPGINTQETAANDPAQSRKEG